MTAILPRKMGRKNSVDLNNLIAEIVGWPYVRFSVHARCIARETLIVDGTLVAALYGKPAPLATFL